LRHAIASRHLSTWVRAAMARARREWYGQSTMRRRATISALALLTLLSSPAGAAISYSTSFDLTETPISEGGAWTSANVASTRVATANGVAFGTQTGTGNFDDSYARLSGFPPDQSVSAVVRLNPSISPNTTHEVEILLRISDGAHQLTGYECNFAFDGRYCQIVRLDSVGFSYLAGPNNGQGSVPGGIHDGDVVSAQIVGDVITASVNGVPVATAKDSTYATGNPGMGFWVGGPSSTPNYYYGFTRYTATAIGPASPVPISPRSTWFGLWALLGVGMFLLRRRTTPAGREPSAKRAPRASRCFRGLQRG